MRMSPEESDQHLEPPGQHSADHQHGHGAPPVAAGFLPVAGNFPDEQVGQAELGDHLKDGDIGGHHGKFAQGFGSQRASDEHLDDHAEDNADASVDPQGQHILGDVAQHRILAFPFSTPCRWTAAGRWFTVWLGSVDCITGRRGEAHFEVALSCKPDGLYRKGSSDTCE